MAFEFASRGAALVCCVDLDYGCIKHLNEIKKKYQFDEVEVVKMDVFKFLRYEKNRYDIIFADPPYEIKNIEEIVDLVFEHEILKPGGVLIIEHHSKQMMPHNRYYSEQRIYGQSAFSFYLRP